jgi:hypothetical protein
MDNLSAAFGVGPSPSKPKKESLSIRSPGAGIDKLSSKHDSPPPGYAPDDPATEADVLAAGLRKLDFSRTAPDPATSTVTTDECIAHLKLLACFADLRDKVATTDGLFNVHDREIDRFAGTQERSEAAALLREKRWAVYVTRAVDRYTAWLLNCVPTDGMGLNNGIVTMSDLETRGIFDHYPEWTTRIRWTEDMLPPLG